MRLDSLVERVQGVSIPTWSRYMKRRNSVKVLSFEPPEYLVFLYAGSSIPYGRSPSFFCRWLNAVQSNRCS